MEWFSKTKWETGRLRGIRVIISARICVWVVTERAILSGTQAGDINVGERVGTRSLRRERLMPSGARL